MEKVDRIMTVVGWSWVAITVVYMGWQIFWR